MLPSERYNPLYPVFLKLDRLPMLIVGGGNVALEKLQFVLKSSPNANLTLVATKLCPELRKFLGALEGVKVEFYERPFEPPDLTGQRIVIAATNDRVTNIGIRQLAHERNIIVNVADTPDLCDFYLGSIVTRGSLKVAISTNGKSPTVAKRMRQLLERELPDDIDTLLSNLHEYRNTLDLGFNEKVKILNELTLSILQKSEQ